MTRVEISDKDLDRDTDNEIHVQSKQKIQDLYAENALLRQQIQSLQLDQLLLFESSQDLYISMFGMSSQKKKSNPDGGVLDRLRDMIEDSETQQNNGSDSYAELLQAEFKQTLKDLRKGYEIALKREIHEKFHYQTLYEEQRDRLRSSKDIDGLQ